MPLLRVEKTTTSNTTNLNLNLNLLVRSVVAAASPLLSTLLREQQLWLGEETAELCWPDLTLTQVLLHLLLCLLHILLCL